jgi:hypothetical protein
MYLIVGKYQDSSEVIDRASTLKEAYYLKGEYEIAYGNDWDIEVIEN